MHKKFIKKDGKTFGPYYYKSYRENGKVKTKYVGTQLPEKSRTTNISLNDGAVYKLFLFIAIIAAFIVVFPMVEKALTAFVITVEEETGLDIPFMPTVEPPAPDVPEPSEPTIIPETSPPSGGSSNNEDEMPVVEIPKQTADFEIQDVSMNTSKLARWFKADAITGASNGSAVSLWVDSSPQSQNATAIAGQQAIYISATPDLNNQPSLLFDGINDTYSFTQVTDIREVYWVIRDDRDCDPTGPGFLLGDSLNYYFIRGEQGWTTYFICNTLWNERHSPLSVLNGQTKLNRINVNGTNTNFLDSSNKSLHRWFMVSLNTTANTKANQITQDRDLAGRVWNGSIAEIIIFNATLTPAEQLQVENYLTEKYFVIPQISFTNPTPANGTTTLNTSIQINVSITESDLEEMRFNWNGANTTSYNDFLVLMMNFDNRSSLGENATRVADLSKYYNDGTIYGAVWNSSGKYGGAYQFDGSNDQIIIPANSSLRPSNITITAWVLHNGVNAYKRFFSYWGDDLYLQVASNDGINFRFRYGMDSSDCSTHTYSEGAGPISIGAWHFLAFTYNGTTMVTYIDGNFSSSTLKSSICQSETNTYIGSALSGEYFNGSIDEVRMWDRSLSAYEIKQQYQSNLQKFNQSQWYFYNNQSNLSTGTYTFSASAKDIHSNGNQTETRTVSITAPAPPSANCSDTLTKNSELAENLNCSGNGITIGADNVTLDCMGYYIIGDNSGDGIDTDGYNGITIKNCNVTGFYNGLYLANSENSTITDNILEGNSLHGVKLENSSNINVTNNFINENIYEFGIYLLNSNSNYILNNIVNGSYDGIEIESSSYNVIENNTFNESSNIGISFPEPTIYTSTYSAYNNLTSNFIYSPTSNSGILIVFSDSNVFRENTVDSNGAGLGVLYSLSNEFYGNIFSNNDLGIHVEGADSSIFLNNELNNPSVIDFESYSCSGIIITNMTFSSTDYPTTATFTYSGDIEMISSAGSDDADGLTNISKYIDINDLGSANVQLNISYNDSDLGLVSESTLRIYDWDGGNWVEASSSGVDTVNNVVYADIDTFSTFGVMGEGADTIPPSISFVSPTPVNGTSTTNTSAYINVSATDENLASVFLDWNRSLVGYWGFNDGDANDSSTWGNNGTVNGATWNSSGKIGGAYNFDGDGDYIDIPNSPAFNFSSFSATAWIKTSYSYAGRKRIINQQNGPYWGLNIYDNRIEGLDLFDGDGTTYYNGSSQQINDGLWHFVAVTRFSGDKGRLYLDGQMTYEEAVSDGTFNITSNVQIGRFIGNTLENFNGTIDEVRLWNRALSPEEINASYNAALYKYTNNFTNLSVGNYSYQAWALDDSGNVNKTETRTLTITSPPDTTPPSISFVSPTPVNGTSTTNNFIPILINADDENYKNYTYSLYNSTGLVSNEKYYREDRISARWQACVLLDNRNITCWGYSGNGQIINYTSEEVIGVSAGGTHTCVLLNNGNVECWGGVKDNYTNGDAIGVSTGYLHSCALLNNGNVNCWGNDTFVQGNNKNYTGGDAVGVYAGLWHTCALLNNGNVSCWGNNSYGQANNYTGGDAIGVAGGAYHTCILKNNGNVTCQGDDSYGQENGAAYSGGNAIGITAGVYHSCALLNNGNVSCWGNNTLGQAKNYTQGNAIGVTAASYGTCALLNNGNVSCWSGSTPTNNNYTLGDAKKQSFYAFQNLNPGTYYLNATACDTLNNCNSTETRIISITADPTKLTSCGNLNITNATYYLMNNVTSTDTCFNIQADNVTLDCQGYTILGTGGSRANGIVSTDHQNIKITNCIISNFSRYSYNSIAISSSSSPSGNITITNINIDNSGGIYLLGASLYHLTNNYIQNISGKMTGWIFMYNVDNSTFKDINVNTSSDGFGFDAANYNNNFENIFIRGQANGFGMACGGNFVNNTIKNMTIYSQHGGISCAGGIGTAANNTFINLKIFSSTVADINNGFGTKLEVYNLTLSTVNVSYLMLNGATASDTASKPADSGGKLNIGSYIDFTGGYVIANVSYNDNDWQNAGVNESLLKLYDYNGGWILVNGSGVDTVNNIIYAPNITTFSTFAPMADISNIDSCQNLTSPNTAYYLQNNVSSNGTCFNITANNVTLDCQGYMINYSLGKGNSYGVVSYRTNDSTIKNCNFYQGNISSGNSNTLQLEEVRKWNIYGNTFYTQASNCKIMNLQNSNNITFSWNNITNANANNGAIALSSVYNSTISNNNLLNNPASWGIQLSSSKFNIIDKNYLYNIGICVWIGSSSENNTISYNTMIPSSPTGTSGVTIATNSRYNKIIGNNFTLLNQNKIGITIESDYSDLINNSIYINNYGSIGLSILSSNNKIINNTVYSVQPGTPPLSIELGIYNSAQNNTVNNLYLRSTNISLSGTNIDIKSVISGIPADSNGIYNISSYVNITNNSAGSFALLNISYNNIPAWMNENSLRIYKHNGTDWINASITLSGVDTVNNVVYANITNFSTFAVMGEPNTQLTECGNLTLANTVYLLANNVSSNETCFNIQANNVTLDCQGYAIDFSVNSAGNGVYATSDYPTVKNCKIIQSNSSINSAAGIYTINYGIITDNNISIAAGSSLTNGIQCAGSGNNIYLNKITMYGNNAHGLYGVSGNVISNNTIITYGLSSPAISDFSSSNITYNIILAAGTGIGIEEGSNKLIQNNIITTVGYAVYIPGNNNKVIGNTITATSTAILTYNGGANNIIRDNNITSTSAPGIFLLGSRNDTVINNTIITAVSGGNCIQLSSSYNNLIENNTVYTANPVNYEFSADASSYNITVRNLYLRSANISFYGQSAKAKAKLLSLPSDSNGIYNLSSYVDITNTSANSWILLNISYSSIPPWMNENSLRIYKHNGTDWINASITLSGVDTVNNVVYANITNFSTFAVMGEPNTQLTECGNLTLANTVYLLANNVSSNETCFNIQANNVTLDCQGHLINHSNSISASQGIFVKDYSRFTLKNCIVNTDTPNANSRNIYIENSENNTIFNNTIINLGGGNSGSTQNIYLTNSNYCDIFSNNLTKNEGYSSSIYYRYSDYNNFSNNYLYSDNPFDNFFNIRNGNKNNFINNTFKGNVAVSFSTNNENYIFSENKIYNAYNGGGTIYGLFLSGPKGFILENNEITLTDSSGDTYGLGLSSSHNNTIINTTINVNSVTALKLTSSENNTFINLNIGSAKLSFNGYNIDIKDPVTILGDSSVYNISQYANISSNGGNSWALMNFTYSDSNIPAWMDENSLRIYKWNNSDWISANASSYSGVDTVNNVVYANITNFSTFAVMGEPNTQLTECGNLTLANTVYLLANNVSSNETCFNIQANNVTLDCQGNNITFSVTTLNGQGIHIDSQNYTTIKNCKIIQLNASKNSPHGIDFSYSKNSIVSGNEINVFGFAEQNNRGIYLYQSDNISIIGNNITKNCIETVSLSNSLFANNTFNGIVYLSTSSNNNRIETNNFNSAKAIYLYNSCNYNNLSKNNISSSGISALGPRGIEIMSNSRYNNVFDNNITAADNSFGIATDSNYNTFLRNSIIISTTTSRGFSISSSHNILINNLVYSNSPLSIDYSSSGGINNTVINLNLKSANISFLGKDINIISNISNIPGDSNGLYNISSYVNITNTSSNSEILLNISYSTIPAWMNENSLRIYKWNNSDWINASSTLSGVDTVNNVVYANITNFSTFAVMGEAAHAECGDLISSDTNLTVDLLNCPANGLNIGANGITLDCQGHSINGTSAGDGINITNFGSVKIKNCNINNFYRAFKLSSSANNNITNCTSQGDVYETMYLTMSGSNIFAGCNFSKGGLVSPWGSANQFINTTIGYIRFELGIGHSFKNCILTGGVEFQSADGHTLENNTFIGGSLKLWDASATLKNQTVNSYDFSGNSKIILDEPKGKLEYLSSVVQVGTNLSEDIKISDNLIIVNSSKTGLNVSAKLTLYNTDSLGLSNRHPYRNGALCPANICAELVDSSNYVFNVTGFTNYSVGEYDVYAPNVSLISPSNNSLINNPSQIFSCNATDDANLKNMTLYIWNSTNTIVNQTTRTITGTFNETNFTVTLPYEGNFSWNCLAFDSVHNSSFALENWTLNLDVTFPQISINSPLNKTYNTTNILVDISAFGADNIWFNNGTANESYTSPVYRTFSQGSNNLKAWANDSAGNVNSTNVTFFVDSVYPLISIVYPQAISYNHSITALNYTLTELNPSNCWYSLNNGANISVTCGNNITSISSSEGSNTWRVYANDSAGNINGSAVTFIVDTTAPIITIINPTNNAVLPSGTTQTTIQINTNENAICRYNLTSSAFSFSEGINFTSTGASSHTFLFSPLANGQTYTLHYKCNDSLGNINPTSTTHTFSVSVPSSPPPSCSNDCSPSGSKQCSGNGYQTCGNYDADSCLEWSTVTACPLGQTCENGNCITPPPTCTNQCTLGTKECASSTSYRNCITNSSSGCTIWSYTSCPAGDLCNYTTKNCYTPVCSEDWFCENWGSCALVGGNPIRQRVCTDLNNCSTVLLKPITSEPCCSDLTPPATCSPTKPKYCSAGNLIDDCSICGCSSGELCNSTSKKCYLPGCTADKDCPAGFECKNGECFAEEAECDIDADCPSDKYCYYGVCKKLEQYKEEKPAPSDCPSKFNCSEWSNCSVSYGLNDILKGELASGQQERKCIDENRCSPTIIETRECIQRANVKVEQEIFCLENYINIYDDLTGKLVSRLKQSEDNVNIELGDIVKKVCFYCTNGIKDYDEVYIDCGGSSCKECNLKDYMEWNYGSTLELTLTEGQSVLFSFNGEEHILTAAKITDNLLLEIKSPISVELKVGESKMADVNEDGTNDIYLYLKEISDNKAILEIRQISAKPAMPMNYLKFLLWAALAILGLIVIREISTLSRIIPSHKFRTPDVKVAEIPEIKSVSKISAVALKSKIEKPVVDKHFSAIESLKMPIKSIKEKITFRNERIPKEKEIKEKKLSEYEQRTAKMEKSISDLKKKLAYLKD